MPSFMVVIGMLTEAAPDGMVAVTGSVTSVRSVDKRSTVNGWVVGVFLVMVSVPALAEPSANVIGLADSCREGPSLSLMVILAETKPAELGGALHPQEFTKMAAVTATVR